MTTPAPPPPTDGPDPRDLAVCTSGLRKTYASLRGRSTAVSGLDLRVPYGGVHGFLGPNGSGKTTLLRAVMGLLPVRTTSGSKGKGRVSSLGWLP